jgi:(p)ppGpp synthase/HD superfamily hydrolase
MKDQATLAREIATKAHEGQFRWDGKTPYIVHPAAVAKAVFASCNWQYENDQRCVNAVATAWLHDVVEDTAITFHDLDEAGVHPEVIAAVDAITNRDGESYLEYLLRVKDNEIALTVKIEDIKNNMSDLDRKKKKSMYEKYQLALHILSS